MMGVKLNILAADIHKRMVDDNRFGYSWAERYGATHERWTVDGIPVDIKVGDYDCSSSTITAWTLALRAAGIELKGATYTGDMEPAFLATGLFTVAPVSQAKRGDLYLNKADHVAMAQADYPGPLSEFSSNEHGGAYGGVRGDQTGWEAHMGGFYHYPWDLCLHYIGDIEVGSDPKPAPKPVSKARVVQLYRQNGTEGQRWELVKDGDWYFVKNRNCGLVLDVKGGKKEKGTQVQLYPLNRTDAQRWKLVEVGGKWSKTYKLVSKLGLVLDVKGGKDADGSALQLGADNGTEAQRWYVMDDGTIASAKGAHRALDAKNGGK